MLTRPDKDALRAMLESQVQEKLQLDPDAVTTYAAQPEPERKPYTSKPTVQDKAFHKELGKRPPNSHCVTQAAINHLYAICPDPCG